MTENVWALVLNRLRVTVDPDEYRRWLAGSSQASDSGDLITVWVRAAVSADPERRIVGGS